jgi:hypothetical protein
VPLLVAVPNAFNPRPDSELAEGNKAGAKTGASIRSQQNF